jgi:putative transcriptional regulator
MGAARVVNQLRRLRFDAGEMTQQELAERVGVTRQTIIAIEGEKYAPSLELAFRLAGAFGRPLEEVFQYLGTAATPAARRPR